MGYADKKLLDLKGLLGAFNPQGKKVFELLLFCREVVDLWKYLDFPETDIFMWFYNIDDDADRFPVGEPRKFWSKSALEKHDLEAEKFFAEVPQEIKKQTKLLLDEVESFNS